MAEREQWAETGLGAVVLVAALGFLGYALAHAGGFGGSGGYQLKARFGEVGALAPGATVSVAGVKVGSVTSVALDPKTFLADTVMTINPDVKLPTDSTIKITQDSLLGGQHLAIEPGGAMDNLKPGGVGHGGRRGALPGAEHRQHRHDPGGRRWAAGRSGWSCRRSPGWRLQRGPGPCARPNRARRQHHRRGSG